MMGQAGIGDPGESMLATALGGSPSSADNGHDIRYLINQAPLSYSLSGTALTVLIKLRLIHVWAQGLNYKKMRLDLRSSTYARNLRVI